MVLLYKYNHLMCFCFHDGRWDGMASPASTDGTSLYMNNMPQLHLSLDVYVYLAHFRSKHYVLNHPSA